MTVVRPVILSGGTGTRLWPISSATVPKQFAPLPSDGSLFGLSLERLEGLARLAPPFVVTGAAFLPLVEDAARDSKVEISLTIVEPAPRNTAPAVIAAALAADPTEILVVLPSDHLIGDQAAFADSVEKAVSLAEQGRLVAFGITPTRPDTGYGYIEPGAAAGDGFQVASFREKPNRAEAERYVEDGRHMWNSGMFVMSAGSIILEAETHCGDIIEGVRRALKPVEGRHLLLGHEFLDVRSLSFDHAIMEKTDKAVVVPLDVGWDDVGSFESLWEISAKDPSGNVVSGAAILEDVADSYIHATSRVVAVAGLSEVIVVETPDAVLVIPRSRAQEVRLLAGEATRLPD
ncbi:MAG: sugar phosphate nucleotidyltransferase [Acidimicrobiia bacterium]